ncbi:MAG: hypothetical protein ACOH2M_17120 [Cypionkella sp.]
MSTNPTVPILLNGGRVTSAFRTALFASAARAGTTVNEFVLIATAEKLQRNGAGIDGVFEPGDLTNTNDNDHPQGSARHAG